DCDAPGSHGPGYGGSINYVCVGNADCESGALAACSGAPGSLYVRTAPCGTSPDPRTSAGWSHPSTTTDPAGNLCFTATRPPSGTCMQVGATATFNGTETAAVVGWRDPYCIDNDHDGYTTSCAYGAGAIDCDDSNPNIHPGATEVCD